MAPLRLHLKMAAAGLALTATVSTGFAANETETEAEAPQLSEEQIAAGRDMFRTWSCGSCHVLADAKAMGPIGPSLDNNPNLTYEFVVNRIANGQGAMPPYGGQLKDEQIAQLSAYIMQVSKK